MKTLLLARNSKVYKIVGKFTTAGKITYICEEGTWFSRREDYLFDNGLVERAYLEEDEVECVDTNTTIIRRAKAILLGFDTDYINDELYY